MTDPVISVIMPVYNAAQHLREAVHSILFQTFSDFELIMINDFSTDNTMSIVSELAYKDNRIKSVKNAFKKGLPGALNTGLATARGKYLARADGDDLLRPERLQVQFDYLEKHPHIALVGAGYAPFNEQGNRTQIYHETSSVILAWKCIVNTYFCHPLIMLRREVYEKLGGYPDSVTEDFAWFSKITQNYPCVNIKKILIDYRESPGNYSHANSKKIAHAGEDIRKDNCRFYFQNDSLHQDIKIFVEHGEAEIAKLFPLLRAQHLFCSYIRKQYSLFCFSPPLLQFYRYFFSTIIVSILKIFKKKLPLHRLHHVYSKLKNFIQN